ncbi:hypothetical protein COCNU_scaffold014924G000020 [Cocos nucifera]|nr:hypothetical protein [Cocos nucifera]
MPPTLSDAEEETLDQIFGIAPPPLSKLLTKENLFKVGLIFTDPKMMNLVDLEAIHRMAKKRKASMAPTPKRGRPEAILAQQVVGASSRAMQVPRKESSVPAKVMMPLRSVAPMEPASRPSTSSSRRSSGKPKISIRISSLGPNALTDVSLMEVASKIEDKRKGVGDYRIIHSLLKLKVEDENTSLKEKVKQLKSELTKAKARLLGEKEAGKARAEATKIKAVEAFFSLIEFRNIKMKFASTSYLQRIEDLKEKI